MDETQQIAKQYFEKCRKCAECFVWTNFRTQVLQNRIGKKKMCTLPKGDKHSLETTCVVNELEDRIYKSEYGLPFRIDAIQVSINEQFCDYYFKLPST